MSLLKLLGVAGSCRHYNAKAAKHQKQEAYDAGQHEGVAHHYRDECPERWKRLKRLRRVLEIYREDAFHGYKCTEEQAELSTILKYRICYTQFMDFTTALGDIKQTVEKELLQFFSEKRAEVKKIHPETTQLVDAIADLTSRGGKRTRAFLVWLGNKAVTGDKRQETGKALMHAMVGIELFQSFALIHDDIIDEDVVRRGSPTVHEFFRIHSLTHSPSNTSHAHRFGESMAILAGDLALVWADELMKKGQRQTENGKREDIYQKMKEEVILGQGLDVLAANGLPSADRATINRYKTAWYSVVRPLQIGAAIAGGDKQATDAFVPYGLAVGEGYQLRDDFLDGAISQEEFDTQSVIFEKQAIQAIQAIHASAGAASLLIDFARFALNRDK